MVYKEQHNKAMKCARKSTGWDRHKAAAPYFGR